MQAELLYDCSERDARVTSLCTPSVGLGAVDGRGINTHLVMSIIHNENMWQEKLESTQMESKWFNSHIWHMNIYFFSLGNSVFGFDLVCVIISDTSEIIYLLGWTELERPAVILCSFAHAEPTQCCS